MLLVSVPGLSRIAGIELIILFLFFLQFFFALLRVVEVDEWPELVVVNIMEPESLSVSFSQVFHMGYLLEVLHEMEEFFVIYILHKASDRNTIVKLLTE